MCWEVDGSVCESLAGQDRVVDFRFPRTHIKQDAVVCIYNPSMPEVVWEASTEESLDLTAQSARCRQW